MPASVPLLLLSNGHGEDAIGARLVPALRACGFAPTAMPIVGEGEPYTRLAVPLIGPRAAMPSGGFIYGRPAALARDLKSGLVDLTLGQMRAIREHRHRFPLVLAIGDIVPLAFAWLTRAPFAFVGCAKSDYYLHERPGSYLWHERALLRHRRCVGVYPRDEVTTRNLVASGIAARYLGNPMMDGLDPSGAPLPDTEAAVTVALLPGSRQEAYANFALQREAARAMREREGDRPCRFLAAIAGGLEAERFAGGGFVADGASVRHPDGTVIHLLTGRFADVIHAADVVLGMAGTANEQAVGLGKPVIATPGAGPQFTYAFAEAQTRLLGESVRLVRQGPAAAAEAAWALLADPEQLGRLAENGRRRMGPAGASSRIAEALVYINLQSSNAVSSVD